MFGKFSQQTENIENFSEISQSQKSLNGGAQGGHVSGGVLGCALPVPPLMPPIWEPLTGGRIALNRISTFFYF